MCILNGVIIFCFEERSTVFNPSLSSFSYTELACKVSNQPTCTVQGSPFEADDNIVAQRIPYIFEPQVSPPCTRHPCVLSASCQLNEPYFTRRSISILFSGIRQRVSFAGSFRTKSFTFPPATLYPKILNFLRCFYVSRAHFTKYKDTLIIREIFFTVFFRACS